MPYPLFAYCGLLPWNTLRHIAQEQRQHADREQGAADQGVLPSRDLPVLDDARVGDRFRVGLSIVAAMMLYYQIAPTATVFFLPVILRRAADVHGGTRDVAGARQSVLPGREVHPRRRSSPWACSRRRSSIRRGTWAGRSACCFSSTRSRRSSTAIGPSSCGASCRTAPAFAAAAVFSFCLFAIGWLVFHRAEYAFAENA